MKVRKILCQDLEEDHAEADSEEEAEAEALAVDTEALAVADTEEDTIIITAPDFTVGAIDVPITEEEAALEVSLEF